MTTTVVEEVTTGRGAWKPDGHATGILYYTYKPPLPLDGSNPGDAIPDVWVNRVRRGIDAYRALLIDWGYDPGDRDRARFSNAMLSATIKFQTDRDIPNDGYVGPVTMATILRPLFISVGASKKVHPRWLYGFCMTESGCDPGAQGEDNPPDSGIAQLNVEHGTYTVEQAYDPWQALPLLASRWLAALEKYDHENRSLTISCAIVQHKSPAAADRWFAQGSIDGELVEYVHTVRGNAQEWRTVDL